MLATVAIVSVLAAAAFLSLTFYFRREISEMIQPPVKVPVPVRVDEEVRRPRR